MSKSAHSHIVIGAQVAKLQAENAVLKEQVAQLQRVLEIESTIRGNADSAVKIAALQSKSAALVDALEKIIGHDKWVMFQRCPDCDHNCAGECKDMQLSDYGNIAVAALAAFKGEK